MDQTDVLSEVLNETETSSNHVLNGLASGGICVLNKLRELYNLNKVFNELDYVSKCVQDAPANKLNFAELWKKLSDKAKECVAVDKCWNKSEAMEEIHRQKVNLANSVIQHGAIISAGIIISQAKTMLGIWSAIKDAENIADESKAKVEILKEKMKILSELSAELTLLVSNYESNNGLEDREAKKLFRTITNKKNRLQMQFVDVNRMISDLKVSVNGQKQSVMSAQKEATSTGIVCALNAAGNAIQYFQFQNDIDGKMKALQIGITGLFSLMAFANLNMYLITEKMLQNICGTLQQINELSKQLVAIESMLLETADWLEVNEEEL